MDKIKQLENRITLALDSLSKTRDGKNHDKQDDTQKLLDEIASLNAQNENLSKALAELEAKRSIEAEEIAQLYEKLAATLDCVGKADKSDQEDA